MSKETDAVTKPPDPSRPPGGIPAGIKRLGHYELVKELGRGAQGVVYLAEDTQLHRKVALKVLAGAAAQSSAVRDRFRREAEVTSKLDHPGICGVHDIGEEQGLPFIAMQFVRGTTLADLVEESSTQLADMSEAERKKAHVDSTISIGDGRDMQDVVRLIERAARALHAAHEAGLVHRDIKPGNIMVTPEGHPVLLDFGLARDTEAEGQTLTQSGQIMGTPAYLAPEQIRAERDGVDRRADIYALGVTLYECLTLRRPFDAESFEQLFHAILHDLPPNPRRFNQRIPQDLRTVLETAMERDRGRRYQTAQAFAEDLRRVRSFEPILAKAAGPVLRARKWARRHPAKASAAIAGALFVIAGTGVLVTQSLAHAAAVREHLIAAEQRLAAGDFSGALEAVAQAQEHEPEAPRALELRTRIEREQELAERESQRRADLDKAADARDESAAKLADLDRARAELVPLEAALDRDRAAVEQQFASDAARGAFARREREWRERQVELDRLLFAAREALQLAARLEAPWGGSSRATASAFAASYMRQWREAVAEKDEVRATTLRDAVERHDSAGEFEDELLGRGTISFVVTPTNAEVYLFRYEPVEHVRDGDPVPRLVPVPTTGVGRIALDSWPKGFSPGDVCLRIESVEPDSLAAKRDLRPGDLVLRIEGHSAGHGLYVAFDPDGDALQRVATTPLARVESVNGTPVADRFDWRFAKAQTIDHVRLMGVEQPIECRRADLRLWSSRQLVHRAAPVALRLLCMRGGDPVELSIPRGSTAGLKCDVTAYPLVCGPDNRIAHDAAVVADPGSYLAVVRAEGSEDQRFPIVVPRQGEARSSIELLPADTTPPGFVYVPAGPFRYSGDPDALRSVPEETIDLPGFFIARREVTNAEWFEFVNDPETRQRIVAAAANSSVLYLPRDVSDGRRFFRELPGGRYGHWADWGCSATTPVFGVSWNEVRDYLVWRNQRAETSGEPWVYDLPTQHQWEKAARGVDARGFPWGNRFDFSLMVGRYRKWTYLLGMSGGFEPRDDSPIGVLDMAGSRGEWTRDLAKDGDAGTREYFRRGGQFATIDQPAFRCASRQVANENNASPSVGFRLVARSRR